MTDDQTCQKLMNNHFQITELKKKKTGRHYEMELRFKQLVNKHLLGKFFFVAISCVLDLKALLVSWKKTNPFETHELFTLGCIHYVSYRGGGGLSNF